jgi:hypothetical protein
MVGLTAFWLMVRWLPGWRRPMSEHRKNGSHALVFIETASAVLACAGDNTDASAADLKFLHHLQQTL